MNKKRESGGWSGGRKKSRTYHFATWTNCSLHIPGYSCHMTHTLSSPHHFLSFSFSFVAQHVCIFAIPVTRPHKKENFEPVSSPKRTRYRISGCVLLGNLVVFCTAPPMIDIQSLPYTVVPGTAHSQTRCPLGMSVS